MSFPKFGHGVVAFVALLPLLVALSGTAGWRAFRVGYLAGVVSALGLLYWTALVVVQYGGLGLPVGALVMLVLCLAFGLFVGLFGWLTARATRAFGPAALLAAPAVWVAIEWLRAHTFFRFPWCLLGYSQYDLPVFMQAASFGAVYAVSFLVAVPSALLAYAVLEARGRRRRAALVSVPLVLGAAAAWGALRMREPVHEVGRVRVGLVQGGVLQEEKWVPEYAWRNVDRHLALSEQAAERGARLVVWPESAVPFVYDSTPALAQALHALVRGRGVHLLFGSDDREELGGGAYRIYVGAKMLSPRAELSLRYHKMRLVPFGEYVPLRPLFTLGGRVGAKLVREVSDFTPGAEPAVGDIDGHRLGAFICYEAVFPDLVRRFRAGGADLLVNVTNDAWYGRTSAPFQHMAMSAFRAVENGAYLARAANTGITAVVDPHGRVLEATRLFDETVLVRDVPLVTGSTFYSRHGDVFAWSCLALSVGLFLAGVRRRLE